MKEKVYFATENHIRPRNKEDEKNFNLMGLFTLLYRCNLRDTKLKVSFLEEKESSKSKNAKENS